MTPFESRIQALLAQEGKTVAKEPKESELHIEALRCVDGVGALRAVRAPESKASRLLIESEVRRLGQGRVPYLDVTTDILDRMAAFYGPEYMQDEPSTGKHPIIDAALEFGHITIDWKESDQ